MDFHPDKFDFSEDFQDQDSNNSVPTSDEESTTSKDNKRTKQQVNLKREKNNSGDDPPAKKAKNSKKKKALTVEELNNLKDVENVYSDNLFKLQIKELISEIQIKKKIINRLKLWLKKFEKSLKGLPEFKGILLSEIRQTNTKKITKREKFIDKIAKNYHCPFKTDQDVILKFLNPNSIETFDLFENHSLAGPNLYTCINLKMPKECFLNKDFLNNRYLVKKFYYLSYICENITNCVKKDIIYHENNVLLPILEVQPTENEKIKVQIHVTPLEEVFKPTRFLPNLNNVKQDLFGSNIKDIDVLKETSTVLYNSAQAHDITLSNNASFVKNILKNQEHIQEGITLLLVWLRQRELNVGFGSFTDNILLYFVVYLLHKNKINNHMSSYQVIRIFWNFLSTEDLLNKPISLTDCSSEVLEKFKNNFNFVFLDVTACYNLLAFLDEEIYKKVKFESSLALNHLDNEGVESFKYLFLTKLPFALQYDLIIDLSESLPIDDIFQTSDLEKSQKIGYHSLNQLNQISKLLKKGLNKRIVNLVPRIEIDYEEKLTIKSFSLGVTLNPDEAFNFVEMGPALNDHAKSNEFRKFWGNLSSDRRFRDGSAHVAVYFKTNTIKGKRNIIKKIIKFLLTEKVQLKYNLFYDEFDDLMISKKVVSPYPIGTSEEGCLKIITASDELNKKIRNMQMSLGIMGMQGMSDSLNYTEVFPPLSSLFKVGGITELRGNSMIFSQNKKIGMIPKLVQSTDFVIQMEQSGKWPSTLEGIRSIKAAFYLEISKKLQEENIVTSVSLDCLEVFYEGFVFRYQIFVPKELGLTKREILDETIALRQSVKLESKYVIAPKVTAALKGVQLQHPSFGPGTALVKRWLRSQLIDNSQLSDIVVNLLCASLYLNHTAFGESHTPQIAYLRFLKFFSEFQWSLQPVIVNFNEEISNDDITDLEYQFQEKRNQLQPLYIVTPYDGARSVFTKETPTHQVLSRVQQLSKACLDLVLTTVSKRNLLDPQQFFVPNWMGYDLLIHLRPLLNPRRHEAVVTEGDAKVVLEKYKHHVGEKIPIVNFDPVQIYLKELRENYGAFATFFHDTYGGNTIGVLWNPETKNPKDFKRVQSQLSNAYAILDILSGRGRIVFGLASAVAERTSVDIYVGGKVENMPGRKKVGEKLVFNTEAVIDDFYLLGKDVVKWIEQI